MAGVKWTRGSGFSPNTSRASGAGAGGARHGRAPSGKVAGWGCTAVGPGASRGARGWWACACVRVCVWGGPTAGGFPSLPCARSGAHDKDGPLPCAPRFGTHQRVFSHFFALCPFY